MTDPPDPKSKRVRLRLINLPSSEAKSPKSPPVEIIRSPNRVRTASARMVDGTVVVRLPDGISSEEERKMVETLVGRVVRVEKRRKGEKPRPDLKRRAADLNRIYFGGKLQVREIK